MENQDKVQNDGSKKVDSKTICILVLIGVILVGVIVGICIFCFGNKKEKQQEENQRMVEGGFHGWNVVLEYGGT